MLNEGLEALGTDEHTQPGVFEKSGIRRVRLPSTLRKIWCSAFEGCEDLKGIRLPSGLERIGQRCFYESGIEAVAFPPGLRVLAQGAFCRCERLRSVCFRD